MTLAERNRPGGLWKFFNLKLCKIWGDILGLFSSSLVRDFRGNLGCPLQSLSSFASQVIALSKELRIQLPCTSLKGNSDSSSQGNTEICWDGSQEEADRVTEGGAIMEVWQGQGYKQGKVKHPETSSLGSWLPLGLKGQKEEGWALQEASLAAAGSQLNSYFQMPCQGRNSTGSTSPPLGFPLCFPTELMQKTSLKGNRWDRTFWNRKGSRERQKKGSEKGVGWQESKLKTKHNKQKGKI